MNIIADKMKKKIRHCRNSSNRSIHMFGSLEHAGTIRRVWR